MPSFVQLLHYDAIDHPPQWYCFPSTAAADMMLNPSTPSLMLIVMKHALPPHAMMDGFLREDDATKWRCNNDIFIEHVLDSYNVD